MKKIGLLSTLSLCLFLLGCCSDNCVCPKLQEGNIQQTSQDDIFDKNLKCQEYLDYYTSVFYESYLDNDSPREGKPRGVTLRDTEDYVLISNPHVFYSPITNSCIGTFGIAEGITDDNGEHYYGRTYRIDSIFGYEHARFNASSYSSCYSQFKGSKYGEEYNDLCKDIDILNIENIWKDEIDWLYGE